MNDYLKMLDNKAPSEDELNDLNKFLTLCSDIYYSSGDESPLTDAEFDSLVKYYERKSKKKFKVGSSKNTKNKKLVNIGHKYPELVGTLEKANSMEDIENWLTRKFEKISEINLPYDEIGICLSLKYDGNSACVTYSNKESTLALTRGKDGKGMDLLDVFKDHKINISEDVGIKYEIITTNDNFQEICKRKEQNYSNQRSVVAGILSSDDAEKYVDCLTFVPLVIQNEDRSLDRYEQLEMINEVTQNNNDIEFTFYSELFNLESKNIISEITDWIDSYYQLYINDKRQNLNYMIDGLVIEFMDTEIRNYLGREDDRDLYSIALKFPPMVKRSKITDIEFYAGPTGRITPVAVFEPLYFNGAKCDHTSIANYKRFKELNLAKGDEVFVEYRNDVLCYINKVPNQKTKNEPIPFPKVCNICGSDIDIITNEKNEETLAYCSNPSCPSIQKGRILNYLKKMDIKGIDTSIIDDLFDNKLIKGIISLYKLTEDKIMSLDGYQEKSAKNIVNTIQSKNKVYDYEILGSLHIKNFSLENAKLITKEFTLDEIISFYENSKQKELYTKIKDMKGFKNKTAEYIVRGIKQNLKTIKFLMNRLDVKSYKEELSKYNSTESLNFVITGDLNHFTSRNDLVSLLNLMGHKVVNKISGRTNYLITNTPNSGTVKNRDARKKNVPIITEDQLIEMLNIEI